MTGLVAVLLLALPPVASAITTTWTGATSTDWNTDSNWDNGQPTGSDTAVIDNTSTNNPVVSTAGEVAANIQLSGSKALTISSGRLTVGGQIAAPAGTQVALSGGELTFGTLLVGDAAAFSPTGGAFAGVLAATSPTTLVNAGATYGTSASASDGVSLGANVDLTQTANIDMGGSHYLSIGDHLYTLAGEDITASAGSSPTITIGSAGTLDHSGATGGLIEPRVVLDGGLIKNSGSGTLALRRNLGQTNLYSGTFRTTSTGGIELGTEVHRLQGPTTFYSGISTAGSADLQMNDQTLSLACCSVVFEHRGGTISGSGTIKDFGHLGLDGGDFALGGTLTLNADVDQTAPTDIGGAASDLQIGGLWAANDDITYSGADGTFINVLPTGVFNHYESSPSSVAAPVTVSGALVSAGSNWSLEGDTTIDSDALVQVYSGQLSLDPLTNLSSSTLTGGNYVVDAQTQGALCLPGPVSTLNADLEVSGGASLKYAPTDCTQEALGRLSTINGTLRIAGQTEISSPLTVNGTLAGAGELVGDVVNNGDVSAELAGALDVSGDYTQTANGELKIIIGAAGAGEFGALNVDGSVSLDGDVALTPFGYEDFAQPGDTIPFLTYTGTRSGSFASWITNPPLHDDLGFEVRTDDLRDRVVAVVRKALRLGRTLLHRRNGTATQFVHVVADGKIHMEGRGVETVDKSVEAGRRKLLVEPRGAKRRRLNKHGHVSVNLHVAYTPVSGYPIHQTKTIRLVKD